MRRTISLISTALVVAVVIVFGVGAVSQGHTAARPGLAIHAASQQSDQRAPDNPAGGMLP